MLQTYHPLYALCQCYNGLKLMLFQFVSSKTERAGPNELRYNYTFVFYAFGFAGSNRQ